MVHQILREAQNLHGNSGGWHTIGHSAVTSNADNRRPDQAAVDGPA
jgi:hypothetical protein